METNIFKNIRIKTLKRTVALIKIQHLFVVDLKVFD
jgi:hypothetical protein